MAVSHAMLTREEILAIQDELIAEYSKPDFQRRLHAALEEAGDDHARQNKARSALTLPIQGGVIIKYGFEPSRKGVVESLMAMSEELKADPEISARTAKMSSLVERYAAPDEKWASWPTTGERLHSPVLTPEHSPRNVPTGPVHMKTAQELAEERKHEYENHLMWAGIIPGEDEDGNPIVPGRARKALPAEEHRLTRQQIIDMQDALIKEYQKPEFQDKLHAAMAAAGHDLGAQIHARHEVCLPVQGPIIQRHGFEPSLKGVQESFGALTEEQRHDPDIAERIITMSVLVERKDPHILRERDAKMLEDHDAHHAAHAAKHPAVHVEPLEGRYWQVVGGAHHAHHHGLVVRKGKELSSAILAQGMHEARLSTGAVVREIQLEGERLHYKKITGDGPDFGWVSVNLHNAALLEPAADPVEED